MTNLEKLKKMSVDEIEQMIEKHARDKCMFCNHYLDFFCWVAKRDCKKEIIEWLKSEVKTE